MVQDPFGKFRFFVYKRHVTAFFLTNQSLLNIPTINFIVLTALPCKLIQTFSYFKEVGTPIDSLKIMPERRTLLYPQHNPFHFITLMSID